MPEETGLKKIKSVARVNMALLQSAGGEDALLTGIRNHPRGAESREADIWGSIPHLAKILQEDERLKNHCLISVTFSR